MTKRYSTEEIKQYLNRYAYDEVLSTYNLDSVLELLKLAGLLNEDRIVSNVEPHQSYQPKRKISASGIAQTTYKMGGK